MKWPPPLGKRWQRNADISDVGYEPISGFALHDAALSPPDRRRLCHGYEGASISIRKYYQTDNQGSITAITDNNGNVTNGKTPIFSGGITAGRELRR
ncbi:MAG: hypothetical protein JKX72_02050 [Robiginitomaculum sp.]|nr:hypothetical protein [Robiginitomaculum sp.]